MKKHLKGFEEFVREQGVIGFTAGFIISAAVAKVVTAIVTDIVNPLVGLAVGAVGDIKGATVYVAGAKIAYGDLISAVIDFFIIAAVVYVGLKILGIEKLDKKK